MNTHQLTLVILALFMWHQIANASSEIQRLSRGEITSRHFKVGSFAAIDYTENRHRVKSLVGSIVIARADTVVVYDQLPYNRHSTSILISQIDRVVLGDSFDLVKKTADIWNREIVLKRFNIALNSSIGKVYIEETFKLTKDDRAFYRGKIEEELRRDNLPLTLSTNDEFILGRSVGKQRISSQNRSSFWAGFGGGIVSGISLPFAILSEQRAWWAFAGGLALPMLISIPKPYVSDRHKSLSEPYALGYKTGYKTKSPNLSRRVLIGWGLGTSVTSVAFGAFILWAYGQAYSDVYND